MLIILNLFFGILFSASFFTDMGAGLNYASGIGTSTNTGSKLYSFSIGIKGRFAFLENSQWFFDLGSRISYQDASRDFINAGVSARSDGHVIEKIGITGLDAYAGIGRTFKFYQPEFFITSGLASIFYDGIIDPQTLYRQRENAFSMGFALYNGFILSPKLTLGPELGYKLCKYVEINNLSIFTFLINLQYMI